MNPKQKKQKENSMKALQKQITQIMIKLLMFKIFFNLKNDELIIEERKDYKTGFILIIN